MRGLLARLLFRTNAPTMTPPFTPLCTFAKSSLVMSMAVVGRATPYFIRSTRFVPPPRNFVPRTVIAWVACSGVSLFSVVVADYRGREDRHACCCAHRGDDVWVRAASANVSAHPFTNFIIAQRYTSMRNAHLPRRLARRSSPMLFE